MYGLYSRFCLESSIITSLSSFLKGSISVKGQGRNYNVDCGGGVYFYIFMFCPADFFSN